MKRSPHIRALSALGGFINYFAATGENGEERGVALTVSVFLLWAIIVICCTMAIAFAATFIALLAYDSPFIMTSIFAAIAICVWAVKVRNREDSL